MADRNQISLQAMQKTGWMVIVNIKCCCQELIVFCLEHILAGEWLGVMLPFFAKEQTAATGVLLSLGFFPREEKQVDRASRTEKLFHS